MGSTTFVPAHDCAQTRLYQNTIVPRHVTFVPMNPIEPIHNRAHSTVPSQDCHQKQYLSRDTTVPRHNKFLNQTIIVQVTPCLTIVPRCNNCAHTISL